jgi:hypothetical protein
LHKEKQKHVTTANADYQTAEYVMGNKRFFVHTWTANTSQNGVFDLPN